MAFEDAVKLIKHRNKQKNEANVVELARVSIRIPSSELNFRLFFLSIQNHDKQYQDKRKYSPIVLLIVVAMDSITHGRDENALILKGKATRRYSFM